MAAIAVALSTPYWSIPEEELLTSLQTPQQGLSTSDAVKRLGLYGFNRLHDRKKQHPLFTFLKKFLNPLIVILLFAASISALFGEVIDFFIILSIIIISIGIDSFQQHQAEQAAEKLRRQVSLSSTVIRDNTKQEINAINLVPGDIVTLAVGDITPADGRIITAKDFLVEQSALTGESYPQSKSIGTLPTQAALIDRTNSVFLGTHVVAGEATAVITRTGSATEFGAVQKQLEQKRPQTAFEQGITSFGFLLMRFTFALVIFVFFVNALFKHDVIQSFLFSIALAVGLTPELLPMIITINLAKGGLRMSKKGVIVKFLPAIQNLGSMDILCTDKTGTLTEGKIVLERYEDVQGNDNPQILQFGYVNSHFQTGLKSPMDHAILAHTEVHADDFSKVDEIPFDFERRRLSVVTKHNGKILLITKGAPESVFLITNTYANRDQSLPLTDEVKAKIHERFESLSRQGYRVLALAYRTVLEKQSYDIADEVSVTLLGLMAFLDPPKAGAKEAVTQLKKQGVTLKILTGDNELVTQNVCESLAIPISSMMLGKEIDAKSDEALRQVVQHTTIFARLNPGQKQRIIEALKHSGFAVGYLGDGINDAPSLKSADTGISVNNAVDVAKEAADLILLRNDLDVLREGVLEGRKTHANVMKYVMMGASSNFGNMVSLAGASLFLPFLPMLPVQVLLNNLLYDFSQISIPTDQVDRYTVRKPKKWDMRFIKHFMLVFGPISSFFDFVMFFLLVYFFKASAQFFQTGWFLESLVTQSLIIFAIRTRIVPFFKSKPSPLLLYSAIVIVCIAIGVVMLPVGKLFSFVPLPPIYFVALGLIMVCYYVLVEVAKTWFYKKYEL